MMKLSLISAAVVLALGASGANAAITSTTGNNFSMVGATGGGTGGTNDVTFTWDGTVRTSVVTDGTSNAALSSPTPFFGKIWTAHNVNIYGTGTYVFYVGCPTGDPSCGSGASYTLNVGVGQLGAHMLFDWNLSTNIDVVQLYALNNSWAGTALAADPMNTATANSAGNTVTTVWSLVSIDTPIDANLYHGTAMIDGPFGGQSANFNLHAVPVPAAVWLLGSGLMGLVGVARRKKAA